MKVITIKQPWASLIINGYKDYEFRTWKTKYRGEIYIQSSIAVDRKSMDKFSNIDIDYPLGCIIGKCILTDCVEINDDLRNKLKIKNKYHIYDNVINKDKNKYGFYITNIEKINPIPVKGKLGIWNYKEN